MNNYINYHMMQIKELKFFMLKSKYNINELQLYIEKKKVKKAK